MSTRKAGRPRSESVRQSVLAAAVHLVENDGYGVLTIEGIARRAGVSKQTIYRWWPSKAEIVLEALNEGARSIAPADFTGSLEPDLRTFVRRSIAGADRSRPFLAALMAEAQLDPDFAETFRRGFLARRRNVLDGLLRDARKRGELAADADVGFLVELVFGMLWYRLLAGHGALNRRFADQVSAAVLTLGA